ncbi:hypothetical protein ACF1BN_09140 [Streptomyces sp. NPDC014861]
MYVVNADADTLPKQQGSTCCADPAPTTDSEAGEPVAAGGCR